MRVIDRLRVSRRRGTEQAATIELLQGDLSAIPQRHAVDALVVSAFPNSYTPNPGTLFEDLFARGLDMREVAQGKAEDQRARLGCWMSTPLPPAVARKFRFSRIVCFEPRDPAFIASSGFNASSIEETVGFVFRCLNNFAIPDRPTSRRARRFELSRVAMPLLATGNQKVPVAKMLPKLLEAAIFWLEEGLPIRQLKVVTFTPAETAVAARIFASTGAAHRAGKRAVAASPDATVRVGKRGWEAELAGTIANQVIEACTWRLRDRLLTTARDGERKTVEALFARLNLERADATPTGDSPAAKAGGTSRSEYDVFISYAHKQDREVRAFVEALQKRHPRLRIFYDRRAIPIGGQWIKAISDAVHKASTFIAVLSPDYTASPVCWDEFQCAKLKEYNTHASVIKTVRLYSEPALPPIMGIYSFADCAEGDLAKLRSCAATLLSA